MDGPVGVTQCPIQPGSRFTYNFTINQPGTYWYHSHVRGQYPDGLRGPLIIHDPDSPFNGQYDEELVLTVSDWYHDEMPGLIEGFISKDNPTGAEPVPKNALFNETQNLTVPVEPGKTYLFRMVNIGAFAGQYVWFEGHNISIVEVDGIYTQPAVADRIYLSAAQRCSFLLTTRNDTSANFPFVASMDTVSPSFSHLPLKISGGTDLPPRTSSTPFPTTSTGMSPGGCRMTVRSHCPNQCWLMNSTSLTTSLWYHMTTRRSLARQTIRSSWRSSWTTSETGPTSKSTRPDPDSQIPSADSKPPSAFFNNITYKAPKVPTLYTALSSGETANNAQVYGSHTHSFVLQKGEVVQLVVDNADTGKHPFHLHGHAFQAVWRSEEDAGPFADSNATDADFTQLPMRRDTFVLPPQGNIVLRFRADNPGVWLFHCHIEWHVESGLIATMVEAPLDLQRDLTVPQNHYDACAAASPAMPTAGNAAGNTANLLDLSGEPSPPARLPDGFTARGIVALVFSCISGVLGVAVVAWYGLSGDPAAAKPTGPSGVFQQGAAPVSAANGNGTRVEEVTAVSGGGAGAGKR